MKLIKLLLLALLASQVALADDLYLAAEDVSSGERTLRQTLADEGHDRFLKLLEDAQLTDYLSKTNITLLIPDEEWFQDLSEDEYQNLVTNREAVRDALHAHTLNGVLTESDLKAGTSTTTLSQEAVTAEMDEEMGLIVNGLVVLRGDLLGPGFAIHV
ncbi:MAG: fasciclin domain-containing protein, partial [Candidatus Eremiobacteraeota bacterium]|nr:fasciclin domain-containing protein [Candidatus Eremiobacteraeota bacterium]